jgi:SAM-dependent methyltransferase
VKSISDYFDLVVDTFDEGYLDTKRRYHLIRRHDVIIEEFERLGRLPCDGPWLDAGCGAGVLGLKIASKSFYTLGIDLSINMIDRCRANAGRLGLSGNSAFQIGDVEALPYADGSLAGIICSGVIEYCEEPDVVLAEFARVLRPGAPIIITFNNALSPYRWVSGPVKRMAQRLIRGKASAPENQAYMLWRARRLLAAAGISVVGWRWHTFACRVRESWFPPLIIARKLEVLSRVPVVRGLGWGLVIVGRRADSVLSN